MTRPVVRHDAVQVIVEIPGLGILLAYGNGAPPANASGYAKGCLWINTACTDANANGLYQNVGTVQTASWAAHT